MANISKILRKFLTKNLVDVAQSLVSIKLPGEVITDDLSANWVFVGADNILRVEVAADTYIAFLTADGGTTAVTASTNPAVKVDAGYHYIACAAGWVRTSANPTRVELLTL